MAPKVVTLTARGLQTQPNDLGQLPEGALTVADNVVVSRDGIIEPRRGTVTKYTLAGGNVLASLWPGIDSIGSSGVYGYNTTPAPTALLFFGDTTRTAPTAITPSIRLSINSGTWTTIAWNAAATVNGYLFGSSYYGPYKADGAAVVRAGMAPGLDMQSTLSAAGTPRALANNSQVAYRVVWGRRLSGAIAGQTILGAPSSRLVVSNTAGGTRDVTLTITAPQFSSALYGWGVVAGDFFQVYRTISSPTSADPGDDCYLAYEGTYTSGTTVSFTDNLLDTELDTALYTNQGQQTILGSNDAPPANAFDVAAYRGCLFFGNVTEAYADLTVLGTGASGIAVGNTITVDGDVITGAAAENIGANQFLVDTTALTPSLQMANTAASIVRVLNRRTGAATARYYAITTDTPTGKPGHIRVVSKGGGGFFVSTTAPVAGLIITNPNVTYANRLFHPNRLMWSKQGQPEAVPALNFADVGSSDKAILRVVPTRDSLFIFKEDGLWRLTGEAAPWTIQPFDPTCHLVGVDSAVSLDNSVFAVTTQGAVRVTDTGVTVISRQIEDLIQPYIASGVPNVGFLGVAYESHRKYHLFISGGPAFSYDLFTQSWTKRTDTATCGLVAPGDDKMLLGGATLREERKTLTDADFSDDAAAIDCAVQWSPKFGDPSSKSHFSQLSLMFRKLGGTTATLSCSTDLVTTPQTTSFTLSDYGAPPYAPFALRAYVPLEASRGAQLNVKWAQSVNGATFQLQGLAVTVRPTSEEGGR